MHTTTTDLPTSILRTRPVWLVSALAGVTAAAATELYGLAARAAGTAHLIAAAVVIPTVTRRLSRVPGRRRP